jgi:hypothetical protein
MSEAVDKANRESILRGKIASALLTIARPPTPLPECSDVILSLIRNTQPVHIGPNLTTYLNALDNEPSNEPTPSPFVRAFKDYFAFGEHSVFPAGFWDKDDHNLDEDLKGCARPREPDVISVSADLVTKISRRPRKSEAVLHSSQPSNAFTCCTECACVTLKGFRHLTSELSKKDGQFPSESNAENYPFLNRLFTADALWLYYMERMGLFQILGALMDDYATTGALPIANDTLAAFVLETMVRQTKTGSSSMQRERITAYRRALGWTTPAGRALGINSSTNTGFNQQFHRLVQSALQYYEAKRLASAINRTAQSGASVATETSISETLTLLRQTFRAMDYGRVHQDTLTGIVWAVGTLGLIHEMRDDIGIPKDFMQPEQLIPAAYDLLVTKRPATSSDTNRYTIHMAAAKNGRQLLLDIQGLAIPNGVQGENDEVKTWLDMRSTERAFENYRTAHRSLTGIDLGAATTRVGEPGSTIAVPQEA